MSSGAMRCLDELIKNMGDADFERAIDALSGAGETGARIAHLLRDVRDTLSSKNDFPSLNEDMIIEAILSDFGPAMEYARDNVETESILTKALYSHLGGGNRTEGVRVLSDMCGHPSIEEYILTDMHNELLEKAKDIVRTRPDSGKETLRDIALRALVVEACGENPSLPEKVKEEVLEIAVQSLLLDGKYGVFFGKGGVSVDVFSGLAEKLGMAPSRISAFDMCSFFDALSEDFEGSTDPDRPSVHRSLIERCIPEHERKNLKPTDDDVRKSVERYAAAAAKFASRMEDGPGGSVVL